MVILVVLLVLFTAAAVAGYTGHGVTDSRDRSFSLSLLRRPPRTP